MHALFLAVAVEPVALHSSRTLLQVVFAVLLSATLAFLNRVFTHLNSALHRTFVANHSDLGLFLSLENRSFLQRLHPHLFDLQRRNSLFCPDLFTQKGLGNSLGLHYSYVIRFYIVLLIVSRGRRIRIRFDSGLRNRRLYPYYVFVYRGKRICNLGRFWAQKLDEFRLQVLDFLRLPDCFLCFILFLYFPIAEILESRNVHSVSSHVSEVGSQKSNLFGGIELF